MRVFCGWVLCVMAPVAARAATFSVVKNLSFGTQVPTAASGNAVVALNGNITRTGLTAAPSGTAHYAGQVNFTGSGLSAVADVVNMTFLSSSVVLSNGSGGTVTVNNFTITPNLQISLLNPTAVANVGGTMTFTSASTPGNYTGSVQIRGNSLLGGTATVTLPITLTLWRTLGITQTRALNFGAVEVTGGNSVIAMSAAGSRSITSGAAGVRLIQSMPGAAASFAVTGNPNTAVSIVLPQSTTLTGPGAAMTVSNFVRSPADANVTLDASGNMTVNVGASLSVNANQAPGTYNGTYTITVNY